MTSNTTSHSTTDRVASPSLFDVREFARTARGSHRDQLDLERYAEEPLDADALRALRYLGRLESSTMEQLRNLLVTATHKDARVTAFLVSWAFEKFWLADAIDQILLANGEKKAQDGDDGRRRRDRSEAHEHRGPIRRALLAMGQGVPLTTVHMTTGLVDEWVTQGAYEHLDSSSGNEALHATIDMILSVKRRHSEFFESEARRRLSDGGRGLAQTRKAIVMTTFPIGAIDRSAADRGFFETFLFGAHGGYERAHGIGERVASLPGLDSAIGERVARGLRS